MVSTTSNVLFFFAFSSRILFTHEHALFFGCDSFIYSYTLTFCKWYHIIVE